MGRGVVFLWGVVNNRIMVGAIKGKEPLDWKFIVSRSRKGREKVLPSLSRADKAFDITHTDLGEWKKHRRRIREEKGQSHQK